jgi:uncharacterized protein YecA (UPF0149 family)
MRTDEITLTLPRDRNYYEIAHLVLGGLAVRHNLTVESLEDLQVALDELLEHDEEKLDEQLERDEERLDELLAEAPDMIAPCVVAIDRFWKIRRLRGRVPKVGRNAPCPCGSGRKFKLCCGRN